LIPRHALVDRPQSGRRLALADSEIGMRKKALVICEVCGGATPSGAAEFVVFHCLAFCSPDCLEDYRTADEERRARKVAAASASRTKRSRAA
jgi:hypothetical protein